VWLSHIKKIFYDIGLSYIFNNQTHIVFKTVKRYAIIKTIVFGKFIQKRISEITNCSHGNYYFSFNCKFGRRNPL
jgi:hypothetical protein